MKIYFDKKKLGNICNAEKERNKKFGSINSKLIDRRLKTMRASDNLAVLKTIPQVRLHELKENRKGCFGVDVKYPQRIVLKPTASPAPKLEDGSFDLKQIKDITILEITDYHGK